MEEREIIEDGEFGLVVKERILILWEEKNGFLELGFGFEGWKKG